MNVQEKLNQLNLVLPPAPKPVGAYSPVVKDGQLAFLSGQISKKENGELITGKVGSELNLGEAQEAAKVAALNVLSVMDALIGFDQVDRVLRIVGYVNAAPNFYEIPKVIDSASSLFQQVFGEAGVHARSAVGAASLPLNVAVELEVTLRLK